MTTTPRGRIVAVEDEAFTRHLVVAALEAEGWEVRSCATIAEAIESIEDVEPHVVICDLDLGPGPSGVDLCQRLVEDWPWIGIVILSAHTSPELAVDSMGKLPEDVVYLVKSAVSSPQALSEAIDAAINGRFAGAQQRTDGDTVVLSHEQAEVLRLIAQAYSNAAIAEQRGTSLRAAEAMVYRVFQALGIDRSPDVNARVRAATMWNSGRISVR